MSTIHQNTAFFRDTQQFEQFYNCHWKKLYDLGCYYTQSPELAEEMVQDVFQSLWERNESFVLTGPPEHYLIRAVKLKIAEHYRTQAIRQNHLEQIRLATSQAELTTERQVLFGELTQRIQNLVDQLPVQCKRVFELSRQQGLNNREIAAQMTLSEKTVENHLTRALTFLRNQLADCR